MKEMEECTQITLDEWMQWKEDIRNKLAETAGNFVHIGYRLKQIRDSGMFGGCADVFEFAQKEYGLGKSTVSRFIAINEKFSEGGNSLELKAEYRAIGSSKLAEMLTLPDSECQLITERTTVKEIRELKQFGRQQPSGEDGGEEIQLSPLQKCLVDYFKDKNEMLNAVVKAIYEGKEKEAMELMNPSGYATHKKGICFIFMYDYSTGVKAKLLTYPEPVTMPWKDVMEEIYEIFGFIYERGEDDIHGAYYGEPGKEADETHKNGSQKTGKAQENQGVEDSVATSQQGRREEPVDSSGTEDAGGQPSAGRTGGGPSPAGGGSSVEAADDNVYTDRPGTAGDAGASREVSGEELIMQIERAWIRMSDAVNEMLWGDCEEEKVTQEAYHRAIDLAAAIERLLLTHQREGKTGQNG